MSVPCEHSSVTTNPTCLGSVYGVVLKHSMSVMRETVLRVDLKQTEDFYDLVLS